MRRHEVLRTTFAVRGSDLVQVVAPTPAPSRELTRIDLGSLAAARRDQEARRLAYAEARRPFDLSRGPLARTALLVLGDREHVLLLTFHHVVFDGWSTGIFLRELSLFYGAAVDGETARPRPLPVQYADFAEWQRRWLSGGELERQTDYWRRQLGGAPEVIDLPLDRPRPAVLGQEGAHLPAALPAAAVEALRRLARESSATLYMALTAVFMALLQRVSGQRDVLMGSPIAGRNRSQLEPLIGFFVNTLVIRGRIEAGTGFRGFLEAVRDTTLEAYAHQDLPFEKLVAELAPKRSRSHSPIFQVMVSHQSVSGRSLSLPGLEPDLIEDEVTTTKFDLTLGFMESPERLTAQMGYRAELFDGATLRRLRGGFLNLLESVTADPDRALGDLETVAAAERHQVLVEWNATAEGPCGRPPL